jgi:hypothetical protein
MDLLDRLEQIELRIKSLQNKCEVLDAENKELKQLNLDLKADLDSKNEAIINLEEQNKIAKLAEGLSNNEDGQALKEQLDQLIIEIDQCINLVKR